MNMHSKIVDNKTYNTTMGRTYEAIPYDELSTNRVLNKILDLEELNTTVNDSVTLVIKDLIKAEDSSNAER